MESIKQRNRVKKNLDLSEWWEKVSNAAEAQDRILKWEKWSFYWHDESKQWIITLKDGMFVPYKVSETVITLPSSDKVRKGTSGRLVNTLKKKRIKLNVRNRVKDSAEAFQRAKNWEKEEFWYVSENWKLVRTLDFSKWEKPRMTEYPRKDIEIAYETVEL